ncbi:MAG: ThuA domain-containing protein [Flavobacteriaceae bacterium]
MKLKSVFVLAIVIIFKLPLWAQKDVPSLKGKNVLIVYGGWEGHKPKVFADKIDRWLQSKKARTILSETTETYTNKTLMDSIDLIIQHITMSEIKWKESLALQKAVQRGVGLAGCHGGIGDAFRNDTEFQYMVGGQFVKHPGGQVNYTVNLSDKPHPITQGLNDFTLYSEQYYMHVDPNLNILASTQFTGAHDSWIEGAVVPVAWTKQYGKGRVFYCSLGHSAEVFEIEEAWNLITRGVAWAVK